MSSKNKSIIEEQNEKIKARFLQVFETIDEGVVYQDQNGLITNANVSAQRILGLTLDQMQGRTSMHPNWRAVREDGSDYPGDQHPAMVTLRTGQIVRNSIMGVYHPEKDKHVWIKINSYPIFDNNAEQPTGSYTTFFDITSEYKKTKALEASENKFRVLFDNAYQFIGLMQPDGTMIDANQTGLYFIGVSREQAIGAKLWETPDYALTEGTTKLLKSGVVKAAKGKFVRFDFKLTGQDGETIILDFSIRPVFNKDKEVIMLIPEGRDITQRIALQKALESEKALNELQSHFVMSASHQFRTPLTIIQSNAELLAEYTAELSGELKDSFGLFTSRISKQVERTIELMDDIMLLGKIKSGVIDPSREVFLVSNLLNDIIDTYSSTADKQRLLLKVKGDEQDVFLDRKLLAESINNLISNALKYSEKKVKINLKCKTKSFTIAIQDNGLGISEADQKNLFQPFFRSQTVKDFDGTGLGLSIAKEYIMAQGGNITFESTLNKGTVFNISFPYVELS